jgi:transposase
LEDQKTSQTGPGFLKRHLGKKCPKCKKRGYSKLTNMQMLKKVDMAPPYPVSRYRTTLIIGIRRDEYHCRNCGKTFVEEHRTFES